MKIPTIQSNSDYESFAFLNGNRPLNKKKIEKIKVDVQNGLNLLPYCPVIVFEKDGKMYIVDGQHRFNASKELEIPVYYVVSQELNLCQIAMMNSKQDKWKETDFLNCYLELGSEHYKTLKEFNEEFHAGIAVTAELLMYGNYSAKKEVLDLFREGLFVSEFPGETRKLLELTTDLFGRYRFGTDRSLIYAVQQIRNKGLCDFEFLKDKIKKAPMMMDKQSSMKEYIYNIERVYNHKASIRKIIY